MQTSYLEAPLRLVHRMRMIFSNLFRVFKRRTAMLATLVVMAAALATASGLLHLQQDGGIVAVGCMACIGVYLIAFSAGAGAIPWFLAGELVPVEV